MLQVRADCIALAEAVKQSGRNPETRRRLRSLALGGRSVEHAAKRSRQKVSGTPGGQPSPELKARMAVAVT